MLRQNESRGVYASISARIWAMLPHMRNQASSALVVLVGIVSVMGCGSHSEAQGAGPDPAIP
jgi:hypothetical protein